MAFVIHSETKVPLNGFHPGLAMVFGSCTSFAPSTGGVINGATTGVRKIACYQFTPTQDITGGVFNVKQSYSPSDSSDILTLECSAGDNYKFWYVGLDNGDL